MVKTVSLLQWSVKHADQFTIRERITRPLTVFPGIRFPRDVFGMSAVTGIFFKLPAGALSDIVGRKRTMFLGLVVFAVIPFTYFLVHDYRLLVIIRFLHGLATAIYGPVSMAVVADIAGGKKGEMLSWFSSITIIGNLLGAPLGGFLLHHTAGAAPPALPEFLRAYLISGFSGTVSLLLAVAILHGNTVKTGKELKDKYKTIYVRNPGGGK